MNIQIGRTIKELRARQKITQEQLATFLGVTPQAVSRWEAESGYPDIETLPKVAEFFAVTVDELLGIRRDEREKRRDEIYRKIKENGELGLGEEVLAEARLFAAEFPSDEKIQENLADTICRAYMWDEKPDLSVLSEAEKIYRVLIDTTKDNDFRNNILESLAHLYAVSFKDKFKLEEVVSQLPLMAYCRESVGASTFERLDGSVVRKQDYIEKLTDMLCLTLESYVIDNIQNDASMWDAKIAMFEKIIELYRFIFGEDMLFYHCRVAGLYRVIATYKVAQGKYDETLDCLENMVYHIKERQKCRPGDKYESPFMNVTNWSETPPGVGEFHDLIVHNDAWYVLTGKLPQSRYDPIREMPRFKEIVDELTKISV